MADTDIPNLPASKITSGTFDVARIPNLSYTKITDITATAPMNYSGGAISLSYGTGLTTNNNSLVVTNPLPYPIVVGQADDGHVLQFDYNNGTNPGFEWVSPTSWDTNTTYALSGALSNHKFTSTLTATNPSGTSTSAIEFVAGSNIQLTDDTTNKKITIAATDTTYTFSTGLTTSGTTISVTNPLPYPIVATQADDGHVLQFDYNNGTNPGFEWVSPTSWNTDTWRPMYVNGTSWKTDAIAS